MPASEYDYLCSIVLSRLPQDEDDVDQALARPTVWDLDYRDHLVEQAVIRATGITPERWLGLNQLERLPYLRETIRALESPPAPPAAARPADTILSLGDRQYQVEGHSLIVCVTDTEENVLQALAKYPAMDEPALRKRTNMENAAKILRDLRKKYGGLFADAIKVPGGKGRGGYSAVVKPAR
jgi:hypothetical protein